MKSTLRRILISASKTSALAAQKNVIERLRDVADQSAAEFINSILLGAETLVFPSTDDLRKYFFSAAAVAHRPGMLLDFGVRGGSSTLMLGDALLGIDGRKVYGFDAFLGIRDAWSKPNRPPGSMSLGGAVPPRVASHEKVELVVGWVEDTLPVFLSEGHGATGLVHLDMDVFPPTKFVLQALRPTLKPGSLLVFDDYVGFIGWQNHSHRAFTEVFDLSSFRCVGVSTGAVAFEYQGFSAGGGKN